VKDRKFSEFSKIMRNNFEPASVVIKSADLTVTL
jgi:hypothetical protein